LINFISNLPRDLRSGGFSAMNAAACAALASRHLLHYAGPIDPPTGAWDKALSKTLRVSGGGGAFAAFSARRLAAIADEVSRRARPEAALDFFHGFTPWIATRPARPYAAWSDCTFRDYVGLYHDRGRFNADDLARIERAEAVWLRGARQVLFTSRWAAERATADYGLDAGRVDVVGIFGEVEPPEVDAYAGAPRFAFVSTDFAAKGGAVVLEAFNKLRARYPETELIIVGAPPQAALAPGVSYAGYLRKEVADEDRRFREILASSIAVVHPSRSDIAPLLLVEAALFGCPTITSRAFAIPELVTDGESGLLIDDPRDADRVADAMRWVLEHPRQLRGEAWRKARAEHSKAAFERRLLARLDQALAEAGAALA
jgi:glycosyltransferase involved in cell wall biosynthesis